MKLVIRNMVCDRCKAAVVHVFQELGLTLAHVDLGEAELAEPVTNDQLTTIRVVLQQRGFELVDSKEASIIEAVKAAIIKHIHHDGGEQRRVKLSTFLADRIHRDYSSLSSLFSQVEGITIEQYFLLQRLERVKELIRYDERTLSEIADSAGFSSVAHLSAQFKKFTGMTPSAFKAMGAGRIPLDQVG